MRITICVPLFEVKSQKHINILNDFVRDGFCIAAAQLSVCLRLSAYEKYFPFVDKLFVISTLNFSLSHDTTSSVLAFLQSGHLILLRL